MIDSACPRSSSPARVRVTGRDPPGRSNSRAPDVALERGDLLADRRLGVAERERRRAERALLRDRPQRGEVAYLDAEPGIVLT